MPGTWNWPDDKKRKSGRSPEPSIWSTPPTERTVTLQELQAALPTASAQPGGATRHDVEFDWDQRTQEREPVDDSTIIKELSRAEGTSAIAFLLIKRLVDRGHSPAETFDTLWEHHSLPVMKHYNSAGHCRGDVQRAFEKLVRTSKDGKPLPVTTEGWRTRSHHRCL